MTTEADAFERNDGSLTISESIVQTPCSLGNFVGSIWQYVKCCWQKVLFGDPFSSSDSTSAVELTSVRQGNPVDFDHNQPLSLISIRRFGDEFRSPGSLPSGNNDGEQGNIENNWILRRNDLPSNFLVNATTPTAASSADENDFSLVFDGDYVNFQLKNTDYDWIFDEAVFGRVSLDGASSVQTIRDEETLDRQSGRSRVWAASLRRHPSETLPGTARSSGYSSRLTDIDNASAITLTVANFLKEENCNYSENTISNGPGNVATEIYDSSSISEIFDGDCSGVLGMQLDNTADQHSNIVVSEPTEKIRRSSFIPKAESLPMLKNLQASNSEYNSESSYTDHLRVRSASLEVSEIPEQDGHATDVRVRAVTPPFDKGLHDAPRRASSLDSCSLIARRPKSKLDELHIVLKKLDDHSEKVTAKPLVSPALSSPDICLPHEEFMENFSSGFEFQLPRPPVDNRPGKFFENFQKPNDNVHSLSEPITPEAQGQSTSLSTSGTSFLTTSIALSCLSGGSVRSRELSLSEMDAPALSSENLGEGGDTAISEAEVTHILTDAETVFLNGLPSLAGAVGRPSTSGRPIQRSNQVDEEHKTLRHLSASQRRTLLRRRISAVCQVTSLLLEGQTRKLVALQWELESSAAAPSTQGSLKAKEQLRRQLITSIERVQSQFDQLEREYTHQALGRLRNSGKSNRSQPAIGLKQTHKNRPTIFGTVAGDQCPKDSTKRGLPQTPKGSGLRGSHGSQDAGTTPEWATLPDDDNSLVYEDGVLVSGSLQALVQHATPTSSYYPDTAYLFAFLLSSRLFIKPHDLLQRVSDLGFTQQGLQNDDTSAVDKDKLEKFVVHIVQLLGEWSETFPYDFRDERVMSCVRTITHRCIALQPNLRRDVTQILHNLLNKLTHLERYEESLSKHTVAPPADSLSDVPDITEICSSPLVMAQQLTHIELERLSFIGPEEFVQAFAKDSNIDSSYKDLKKTNNLEVYVQWFNKLSYLVATQAVSHLKKKQRVRVIEWWIEVARECFNIGNFNSLMGIIAGLNMSPVSRLKKTWSKVQTAKFSVLEHQMDPTSNFSSYRSTLKAAMWRSAGAVDDRQKIVIPFFSLLVKDLYFLNEGCANRLPNGYINFDKFWQLAKQVTEFMAWKQVTCPFERVPHVINYLQSASILSEIGLAHASFECEGPENSYEKERYKNLHRVESQPSS